MMDFKNLKGIHWVGNIYQKFEVICQEVDDIVSQDTIKYVENQVQTVGQSVKKLCSGVVEDFRPSLGYHVKRDGQDMVVFKENSAISTQSIENLEENSLHASETPTEPRVVESVTSPVSLDSSKYDFADQPSSSTSVDTLEVSESNLSVGKIDEVLTNENSVNATEDQSPKEPNVMDPVGNQPSCVSIKYRLADQLRTLEELESDLLVDKIDGSSTNKDFLGATEKQPLTDPSVMDLVTNELSLVSRKDHLEDQPSSPISVDTRELSESGLSLGKMDEFFTYENNFDTMENQSPTKSNVMDPVTNQLNFVSSETHLADQPSSPTSMDTLEVSESDLPLGKIDKLANETSLDVSENQYPTEPNVMHPVPNQLSLVSSKYHLVDQLHSLVSSKYHLVDQLHSPTSMETLEVLETDLFVGKADEVLTNDDSLAAANQLSLVSSRHRLADQPSSPSSMDALEVSESNIYVGKIDEVLTNENSLDATENQSPTEPPNVMDPVANQLNLISIKYRLADQLSSPTSMDTLEVSESDLSVGLGLSSFSSIISFESVAEDGSRIPETMPLTVPSRKQQVQICESVQYGALKSSSDIGCSNESISCDFSRSMETIDLHDKVSPRKDLHDKVKLEESCAIVDDSVLHAVSCRARKLRSYKKRILDAFTSKKRLAKEYEQLAIWFGDTDIDSSQETLSGKSLQTHHACDSEWELL